jgi:hypothetical protein
VNEPREVWRELIAAVVDQTATAEQRARLAELLRTDAGLRAEYVAQMRLDALLHFTVGAVSKPSTPVAPVWPRSRWSWLGMVAAAAAVVMLGPGLAWWSSRGVEVVVVQAANVAGGEWQTGERVRLNRFELQHGALELLLPSGVRLNVVAPVEMQFVDPMHVRVSSGQVTADVGERGKGFVVDTAHAQVVDLGTKFGVAVLSAGHTDVVVFQGEVELFDRKSRRDSGAPMKRLTEGEAVRVDAQRQMSRIMSVSSGTGDGAWSTGGGDTGSVIASVRDNLRDPSALFFYRILAGGMREDAQAFVAKRHEWNGLDASGIPAELVGADLVQTFATDRYNTELEIVVTVARPAEIFVLIDSRVAPPAWLVATFTDTGARIGMENAPLLASGKTLGRGPGVGNMAPFAVWKRTLPQAGSVTLGPPHASTGENPLWMYGIAAKPL